MQIRAVSLLQITTILLQTTTAITNCDNYYKLGQNIHQCVFVTEVKVGVKFYF